MLIKKQLRADSEGKGSHHESFSQQSTATPQHQPTSERKIADSPTATEAPPSRIHGHSERCQAKWLRIPVGCSGIQQGIAP